MQIFNTDQDIRKVLMQLINGFYSPNDPELFRDALQLTAQYTVHDQFADTYFILKDFQSYAEAQKRVSGSCYRDEDRLGEERDPEYRACSGKFTSDRTIQQYVDEIWHLDKITVEV